MDYPSMRIMTSDEYKKYIDEELFRRNHHDVLMVAANSDPVACTKEQIDILIEYLQYQKTHMPYKKDIT